MLALDDYARYDKFHHSREGASSMVEVLGSSRHDLPALILI